MTTKATATVVTSTVDIELELRNISSLLETVEHNVLLLRALLDGMTADVRTLLLCR